MLWKYVVSSHVLATELRNSWSGAEFRNRHKKAPPAMAATNRPGDGFEDDPVPRNELGGVLGGFWFCNHLIVLGHVHRLMEVFGAVDEEELKAAFDFFDVHKKGTLTPADLKQRLGVFYKNLPAREYKFLISEPDFTYKTLHKLLVNNELKDFDPVKEVEAMPSYPMSLHLCHADSCHHSGSTSVSFAPSSLHPLHPLHCEENHSNPSLRCHLFCTRAQTDGGMHPGFQGL